MLHGINHIIDDIFLIVHGMNHIIDDIFLMVHGMNHNIDGIFLMLHGRDHIATTQAATATTHHQKFMSL